MCRGTCPASGLPSTTITAAIGISPHPGRSRNGAQQTNLRNWFCGRSLPAEKFVGRPRRDLYPPDNYRTQFQNAWLAYKERSSPIFQREPQRIALAEHIRGFVLAELLEQSYSWSL